MTALVPEEGPLEHMRNAVQLMRSAERDLGQLWDDQLAIHGEAAEQTHDPLSDALFSARAARARIERALAQLEAKPPAPGIPLAEEPGWDALRDDEEGKGLSRVGGFLEPMDRPKYQRMLNAWRRGYYGQLQKKLTSDNPYLMQTFQQPVQRAWKEGWSACKADLTRGHQPVDLMDRCKLWGVFE